MKKHYLIIGLLGASLLVHAQTSTDKPVIKKKETSKNSTTTTKKPTSKMSTTTTSKEINLNDSKSKFSYAIGVNIADNMNKQGILDSLNLDALVEAFRDTKKSSLKMTNEEAGATLQAFFQKESTAKFGKNQEIGKAFLAENGKKAGVITTASGLQYSIITAGTGEKPKATDKIKCHYHGTLLDGKVFDSSVDRGEPIVFGVNQVIPGWVEALQLMPVGSKWKLFIPQELAYGERPAGAIEPFSTLIFEVELLGIEK